jgi:multicomponent Na+:H+ antiporter subunit G
MTPIFENAVNLTACAFLLAGLAFIALGVAGLLKLPDVYNRMHAATKCMTLGLSGLVIGSALHLCTLPGSDAVAVLGRAAVLILFQFLAGPVGGHLLAKAAYAVDTPRVTGTTEDERKPRSPLF